MKRGYSLIHIIHWFLFSLLTSAATLAFAAPIEFTLHDMQGKTHTAADFRGRWLLVNFWATWCPPCREELPALGNLHEQRADFDVLGINYEDIARDKLETFVSDYMIPYPIIPRSADSARYFGRVRGLPTSLLYSPEGQLVKQFTGPVTRSTLERALEQYGNAALQSAQQ